MKKVLQEFMSCSMVKCFGQLGGAPCLTAYLFTRRSLNRLSNLLGPCCLIFRRVMQKHLLLTWMFLRRFGLLNCSYANWIHSSNSDCWCLPFTFMSYCLLVSVWKTAHFSTFFCLSVLLFCWLLSNRQFTFWLYFGKVSLWTRAYWLTLFTASLLSQELKKNLSYLYIYINSWYEQISKRRWPCSIYLCENNI